MSRLARDLLFLGGAIGEIRLLRDVKDFPRPLAGVEGLVGNVRPVATVAEARLIEQVMRVENEVTCRKGKGSKLSLVEFAYSAI
jgi:hypothetical protein